MNKGNKTEKTAAVSWLASNLVFIKIFMINRRLKNYDKSALRAMLRSLH